MSAKLNPFANYYTPEEPISHIMATVPSTDEFFYNVAYDTTPVIVRGMIKLRLEDNYIIRAINNKYIMSVSSQIRIPNVVIIRMCNVTTH